MKDNAGKADENCCDASPSTWYWKNILMMGQHGGHVWSMFGHLGIPLKQLWQVYVIDLIGVQLGQYMESGGRGLCLDSSMRRFKVSMGLMLVMVFIFFTRDIYGLSSSDS